MVDQHLIEFNQLAMSNTDSHASEAMLNRVMIRDNIGLAVLLELREEVPSSVPQHLLVVNAHIHWDPEYCDVKLIQTIMLMSELENILHSAQSERGIGVKSGRSGLPGIPLVLCGDLNSLPDSGVLEYLLKGRVSTYHNDFLEHDYNHFFKTAVRSSTATSPTGNPECRHSFVLKSAYSREHVDYTNYTYEFKGVIDYIVYSSHFLKLLGVLNGVSSEWMRTYKLIGCPNPHFPSDHFPLLAEFEIQFQD